MGASSLAYLDGKGLWMGYDLVIKNGHVVDGTGRPRFKANVYVEGGRIAQVSPDGPVGGDEVIDAAGLIVCPGFVDMHSHADLTLFGNPRAESFIRQGATTLYVTPDGWSPAPVVEPYRPALKAYYEALAFGASLPFDWMTYDDYFTRLTAMGLGVNVRANVGFGTIRVDAMGFERRAPSRAELEHMKALVDQAFRDGVCGLSTGLTYLPQCYSTTAEVLELCRVVAAHGGLYHTHTRGGLAGVREAVELGERSGVPVDLTHTTPSDEVYAVIEGATARGVDVTFDAYPYTAGSSSLSESYLPEWVHEGGPAAMLQRIRRPEVRERISREWQMASPETWPNGPRNTPLIAWCQNPRCGPYEGKTVNEVAEMMDVALVDAFCTLLIENQARVIRVGLHSRLHRDVTRAYQHPLMLVGSDGWAMAPEGPLHVGYPHPRCYGTFPKVLGRYVRLLGLLTLEDAVKKMTWAPAQRMLLEDRGALRAGLAADITVFNPETVIDNATYANPHQCPTGIDYVVVNGEIAVRRGESTGVLAGQVLRYRSKAD
jgi:N-acyl-D-amino-acid deacylase